MSDQHGAYTFLPWIRHGLANRIGGAGTSSRATVDVSIGIEGTKKGGGTVTATVERRVELYGPGDVVGIDAAEICRVEPEHWVTNFEPNYFAAIEFYDEDFPWRYTPAAPDGRKLLPWLALIVLEEAGEFVEGRNLVGRPLPYIEITASFADAMPAASEGWAWAHAHFNAAFSAEVVETDAAKAAAAAQNVIDSAPDTACSRLLSPRKLKPKTGYHAFLIPAFESGRLAGLGYDPQSYLDDPANGLSATSSAWDEYAAPANRPEPSCLPFYHRWFFRTAEQGDFESLVRLLQPKVVDSRVGHRDMDVTDPAPNVIGIDDPQLGGVLRLGGALKAPLETLSDEEREEHERYDDWATPYPHPFQKQLAAFVNLADSYQEQGPAANVHDDLHADIKADPDPLVTPPIYGRWHALTERLLTERDGSDAPHPTSWLHDLNLDPRWRTAAGFGTSVIQQHQETYMQAAWDQIGDVLEANRRIRHAQLAVAAGAHLHAAHLESIAGDAARVLVLTSPLKRRVVADGVTVRHRMTQSPLGTAMTSTGMRRAIRPGGALARGLGLTTPSSRSALVVRANDGAITASSPKTTPHALPTPDDLADAVVSRGAPSRLIARIVDFVRRHPALALLLLVALALLVALLLPLGPLGLVLGVAVLVAALAAGLAVAWRASRWERAAGVLREEKQTPAAVAALPQSAGFVLVQDADLRAGTTPPVAGPGGADNAEAVRYKTALGDEYTLIGVSRALGATPTRTPLDVPAVAGDVIASIRPQVTVPRWTLSGITIPARISEQMGAQIGEPMGDRFVEAMAYPEFDTPMYEPLVKAGAELFVPNLHLVAPDSVTLLETNQEFIEAYMVGLNHELARELLWREYPTDQRGSYFRQFWDVRKKIAEAEDKEAARERLKDIKPLHEWPITNDLGDNDNREEGSEPEQELVLVIRGELLKKYPNTIISAQPAKWQTTDDGQADKTKERVLDDATAPISPLYEARVAPDIYFFGFDLTAADARGDDTVDDEPGWFFRIEEVPGDARFGFDISREDPQINVWSDLAWPDVAPGLADGMHVRIADMPAIALVEPGADQEEKRAQWELDKEVQLDDDVSAAELAYIALQTPVLMAIHASELLPDQT